VNYGVGPLHVKQFLQLDQQLVFSFTFVQLFHLCRRKCNEEWIPVREI
jgi:hypothetical protein